jgi:hypothetical protein
MEAVITIRRRNKHAYVKHRPTSGYNAVASSNLERLKDRRCAPSIFHSTGTIGNTAAGPWAGEHSIGSDFLNDTGNKIPQRLLTTESGCRM